VYTLTFQKGLDFASLWVEQFTDWSTGFVIHWPSFHL